MAYCTVPQQAGLNEDITSAFIRVFSRTDQLFDLIMPEAYYARPIPLRHPINFYEGHLVAFIWNTLFVKVLGQSPFNERLDRLFARGIDPGTQKAAAEATIQEWPPREAVQLYKQAIRERFFDFLENADLQAPCHPLLKNGEVLYLLLEHEQMHQETLLYMLHQLPATMKKKPDREIAIPDSLALVPHMVQIPAGQAILGTVPGEFDFAWDNELPRVSVNVNAFSMDALNITNGQFLEFIEAGGYQDAEFWTPETWQWKCEQQKTHPLFWKKKDSGWMWRGFFEEVPLPLSWPVYVTYAEAAAYARFAGKELPTEAEWHRAAYGENADARYPWGDEAPSDIHGNFDFQHWSPVPVGSFPKGMSPYGVYDLIGNGWEWTSTLFAPFSGFQPSQAYPQYSADFFDGRHYVIKGASCFTDARLLRRSLRNWYYWHYPYMYATFRCVKRG